MRVRFGNRQAVLVPVFTLILASCAGAGGEGGEEEGWVELKPEAADTGSPRRITGTVHHLDLEGGLYVIRDAEGTNYDPTNLPEAFRVEGLAVEAAAQRRDDLMSIGMVGPMVDLLRIRERGAPVDQPVDPTKGLLGTAWVLEDLAGAGVVDRVQATLEFAEDGTVSGNGSCNRFHGTLTVTGDAITFGPQATTRMMCAEAVMQQETAYLAALREAERFETDGTFLYIHAAGRPQPLRFIGADGTLR
jgi:heat shock protein HslJ